MPVNKNANIRYRTLDKCFRDRQHKYFIEDLVEACEEALLKENFRGGVKMRQIYDDIRFMKSEAGYSIELDELRDGKRKYYRYTDPDFTIRLQPINKDEAQLLQQAITTLTRFRGLPQYEWIEEVITNLEHRFNLEGRSVGIVCFEQNRLLRGLEYLGTLIDAATDHNVLKVEYHNYKNGGRDITYIFHTYYVKQYNNRWFAFGHSDGYEKITTLALDRIESIEQVKHVPFIVNEDIDFDHYFDSIVGVTIPDDTEVKKVVFRTNKDRYPLIYSKPIHPSQRIVDRKQHILQIEVAINLELEQKLLSFGADIEVLEPESFREQMKKKVEDAYKKYFPMQEDCTKEQ